MNVRREDGRSKRRRLMLLHWRTLLKLCSLRLTQYSPHSAVSRVRDLPTPLNPAHSSVLRRGPTRDQERQKNVNNPWMPGASDGGIFVGGEKKVLMLDLQSRP